MEKYACGERPHTREPLIIKMGYLLGTLRWRNNALSVKKYDMAALSAVIYSLDIPIKKLPNPNTNNEVIQPLVIPIKKLSNP